MNISKLNKAQFVKVYEDSERVYAWFGGFGVSIYDLELNEIDYFTVVNLSPKEYWTHFDKVKLEIELHEDELFADEDCTDDMLWQHWLETGEDLEVQT